MVSVAIFSRSRRRHQLFRSGLPDHRATGPATLTQSRPLASWITNESVTQRNRAPSRPACLDPFDRREPGRCTIVVVPRLNPVRFDRGDMPSGAGIERRTQLFPTDGMRAGIGTNITEAQHIQGSTV